MEFPKDWDLDKYKSEYESEEHWELRKKFMETHKNKFPEDKLVCLARVFFNIEFLGCRYPDKTMKLIAELSAGVADDYREKKKGKLKRTFVQASDAAEAKIKRTGSTSTSTTQEPPHKLLKTSFHPSTNHWNSCSVHESVMKHQDKGEFPGFVIYESVNCKCPISLLSMSVHKSKMWKSINFDFPESKNSPTNPERFCEVSIDGKVLASGVGIGNKEAKKNAAINGLKKLRETCYTIQEKVPFSSGGDHVSKDTVVSENKTPETLPMDNIGSKMMLRMGWTGSGLGKNQQGIKTPIQATNTMRRAGFGHMNNTEFRKKFKVVLMDYMESDTGNDLVFAPDFSKEERKILHELAQRLKLKTKSHGENEQRQLVVFKILTPPEIVEMLLRCGGENDKYLLVPPHTEESKSPSSTSCFTLYQ
ncbi:NF-kappa-B-repressing factor-like isoform X3 [Macrosteles quadrilineatus]|uniref:NF-kappa-B-repressing factor-like isoform X3 n=1 Tax=Macrosteles quadrilineatus TaxID=74068 RepID=UPI0023E1B243|nr:NF-kappa-B-repressing factor-like isoform X3 [Macrosteles quadrilineatus]